MEDAPQATEYAVELSVVIPVYNEEARLPKSLPLISAYLDGLGGAHEIIFVDDGSTDATRLLLASYAEENGNVRILTHESNLGKGFAVRTGMLAAGGRFVVFSDADLSTPIETADVVVRHLSGGCDVVVGNRRVAGSMLDRRQPWLREFLGRIFTRLTRIILRSQVTDQTCGFKGFTAESAREIFTRQRISDWSFDAEILHIASRQGLEVEQVPVRWHDEPGSKVRVISAALGSAVGLVRIWHNGVRGWYN